jgi:hypothetical protein
VQEVGQGLVGDGVLAGDLAPLRALAVGLVHPFAAIGVHLALAVDVVLDGGLAGPGEVGEVVERDGREEGVASLLGHGLGLLDQVAGCLGRADRIAVAIIGKRHLPDVAEGDVPTG